jgi:Domain of unknown function (DUF6933)
MITLRCTQKLQRFLGIVPASMLELTTATLGDWYANLVPTVSGDLIVFVNEKSLLTVAIPIEESNNLIPLFRLRVANLLGLIGINPIEIINELCHYDQVQFGKTASRRILGSMNDITLQYQIMAEDAESKKDLSLSKAELNLSQLPCKPIGYRFPSEIAKELLYPKKLKAS